MLETKTLLEIKVFEAVFYRKYENTHGGLPKTHLINVFKI